MYILYIYIYILYIYIYTYYDQRYEENVHATIMPF